MRKCFNTDDVSHAYSRRHNWVRNNGLKQHYMKLLTAKHEPAGSAYGFHYQSFSLLTVLCSIFSVPYCVNVTHGIYTVFGLYEAAIFFAFWKNQKRSSGITI